MTPTAGRKPAVQASVEQWVKDKVALAAERMGVSESYYVALLCTRDEVDNTGRPVWASLEEYPDRTQQEELGLSA